MSDPCEATPQSLSPATDDSAISDNYGTPPRNYLHSQQEESNSQEAKSSTKRLFSNRESTTLREELKNASISQSLSVGGYASQFGISQNGRERNNEIETEEGAEAHIEKRHRTSDWPLKPSIDRCDVSQRPHIRHSNSSTHLDRQSSSLPKASKFIEGSMNDRASKRPPLSYSGGKNEVWEQYENEQCDSSRNRMGTQPSDLTNHTSRSTGILSRAERPNSSVFRFGKSLAATFNPSNWRIWSKSHDEEDVRRRIFKERQEKVEKIYNGMHQERYLRESTSIGIEEGICTHLKDDTDVGFGHDAPCDATATRREKRYGKVFLDTPSFPSHGFNESPTSETPSFPREPPAHPKKPSLPNLGLSYTGGNIKHPLQLDGPQSDRHGFRRVPSRRELQKQQKLVKRVSDLEGKLEAARRQLSEALGEPVPVQPLILGRKRFTPSALTTLPSERVLSAYTTKAVSGDEQAFGSIGRAISTNERSEIAEEHKYKPEAIRLEPLSLGPATFGISKLPKSIENQGVKTLDLEAVETPRQNEIRPEHNSTMAASRRLRRNRKGIGIRQGDDSGEYKPSANSQSGSDELETQLSIPETKPGRPRKLRKVEPQETACGKETESTKNNTPSNLYPLCKKETIPPPANGSEPKNPTWSVSSSVLATKKAVSSGSGQIPRKDLQTASPQLSPIASSAYVPAAITIDRKALQGEYCEAAYGVEPSDNAPPVPKLPSGKASMKHSDERIDRVASPEYAHLEDSQRKPGTIQNKRSFEWPADVF